VLLICAACALAPGGALAGTLDQQQTSSEGAGFQIHSGQSVAQTFTAGLSGEIDQVDLDLEKSGAPTAPLTVEIRSVSGGVPDSTVLGTATVPASAVTLFPPAFVPVSFAVPAPVTAGTQYAIVAYAATAQSDRYEWSLGATPDPYPAGAAFFIASSPPTGTWTSGDPEDLTFKTYVAPVTTTPVPTPTGRRAAALKQCKKRAHKKHWSHKRLRKCKKKANLLPV
jgi:hypothetical protein